MELDLKKAQEFQLQFDGMEVDTIKTAAKVRKFFKQDYPKLMLWAGVNGSYIKSPVITDEPRSTSFGNRADLIGVYAENKDAWSMCDALGCERSRYQQKKRKAENEFADAFETCCLWWKDLHVYKK